MVVAARPLIIGIDGQVSDRVMALAGIATGIAIFAQPQRADLGIVIAEIMLKRHAPIRNKAGESVRRVYARKAEARSLIARQLAIASELSIDQVIPQGIEARAADLLCETTVKQG